MATNPVRDVDVATMDETNDNSNGVNGNSFDKKATQEQHGDYEAVEYNDNFRDDSNSGGGSGMECDCLGGGIFSFLLGLFGGGGRKDDDVDY